MGAAINWPPFFWCVIFYMSEEKHVFILIRRIRHGETVGEIQFPGSGNPIGQNGGGTLQGKGKYIFFFMLGFLCFAVAQPLLRLPLLQMLQQTTGFTMAYITNPLLCGVLVALTAGIFEETFRFLFKAIFMKPARSTIRQPILFGLGHGISEVCVMLYPVIPTISMFTLDQLSIVFAERIMALTLHVSLTIMVWNGFQRGRKAACLLSAILVHGLADALIPIISSFSTSVSMIEGAIAVVATGMVVYAYHSRKYYLKEENQGV